MPMGFAVWGWGSLHLPPLFGRRAVFLLFLPSSPRLRPLASLLLRPPSVSKSKASRIGTPIGAKKSYLALSETEKFLLNQSFLKKDKGGKRKERKKLATPAISAGRMIEVICLPIG